MAENDENSSADKDKTTAVDVTEVINSVKEQIKSMAEQSNQANQQLFQEVQGIKATQQAAAAPQQQAYAEEESFLDLDPKAYEKRINAEVDRRVDEKIHRATTNQAQISSTIAQIVADYPEANQAGSDMQAKIVEVNNALGPDLKDTPAGYELAASKAAKQLGLIPKSLRQNTTTEDFSMSASNSGSGKRTRSKSDELEGKTLAFAELVGLNVKDPKQIERLKERASRTNYKRYDKPGGGN